MVADPKTSVVLPVHNGGTTLPTAIESVLAQTDTDFELVVVDDGSVDGTAAVLADCERVDERVVVLRHDVCRGIVPALNYGLRAARGRYVARMDADDWCHPQRLALQSAYLDSHTDIGLVGCRAEFGGDRSEQTGYALYVDWINSLLEPDAIALNRFVESPFAHPSVMFRSTLWRRLGEYRDGAFPEDYELWLRWLDAGVRMAKIPEFLVRWNDPPTRLSRTDSRYSVHAFYECKAQYLAAWLARHNAHHPRITVWGAGRETRKRARYLTDAGVRFGAYVDIDPRKIGQVIHGVPVWAEADLPEPGECFVVSYVGSRGARADIRRRLTARGYVEGRHFVMAA